MKQHKYFFAQINKKFQINMKTEQFELSEKILEKRYSLGLSFQEAMAITGLDESVYLDIEYGEPEIPINLYRSTLYSLEQYGKNA